MKSNMAATLWPPIYYYLENKYQRLPEKLFMCKEGSSMLHGVPLPGTGGKMQQDRHNT